MDPHFTTNYFGKSVRGVETFHPITKIPLKTKKASHLCTKLREAEDSVHDTST